MHPRHAHDGEALSLPVGAVARVRLRMSFADQLLAVLRWTLGLAGAVVALWLGTAILTVSPAAAAVPVVAAQAGLAKVGFSRPAAATDDGDDSDSGSSGGDDSGSGDSGDSDDKSGSDDSDSAERSSGDESGSESGSDERSAEEDEDRSNEDESEEKKEKESASTDESEKESPEESSEEQARDTDEKESDEQRDDEPAAREQDAEENEESAADEQNTGEQDADAPDTLEEHLDEETADASDVSEEQETGQRGDESSDDESDAEDRTGHPAVVTSEQDDDAAESTDAEAATVDDATDSDSSDRDSSDSELSDGDPSERDSDEIEERTGADVEQTVARVVDTLTDGLDESDAETDERSDEDEDTEQASDSELPAGATGSVTDQSDESLDSTDVLTADASDELDAAGDTETQPALLRTEDSADPRGPPAETIALLSSGESDEDESRESDDEDRDDRDDDKEHDDSPELTERVLEGRIDVDNSKEELEQEKAKAASGEASQADYDKKAAEHAERERQADEDRAELSPDRVELVDEVVDGHRELSKRESELDAEEQQVAAGAVDRDTHEKNLADFEERRDDVYEATDELMEATDREVRTVSEDDLDGEGAAAGCDSDGAFVGCGSASESADGKRHSDRKLCLSGVSSCGASSESGGSKAEASCDDSGCGSSASSRGADGRETRSSARCDGDSRDCGQSSRATRESASAECESGGGTCRSESSGSGQDSNRSGTDRDTVRLAADDESTETRVAGSGSAQCESTSGCGTSSRVDMSGDGDVVADAETGCETGCTGSARTSTDASVVTAGTDTRESATGATADCTVNGGSCSARSASQTDGEDGDVSASSTAGGSVDCDTACTGSATGATSGKVTGSRVAAATAVRETGGSSFCAATNGGCAAESASEVGESSTKSRSTRSHRSSQELVATSTAGATVACAIEGCAGTGNSATSGAASGDVTGVRDSTGSSSCTAHGAGGTCSTASDTLVSDREPAPGETVAGVVPVSGPVSVSQANASVECAGAVGECGGTATSDTSARDTAVTPDSRGTSASTECTVTGGGCVGTTSSAASSADDFVATDPNTGLPLPGRPASGPSSTANVSASLACAPGTSCTGSVRTSTTARDGAVTRTSDGTASCTGATGGCEVRSVSTASSGPGAALALTSGPQQVNAARLPAGPSAASAAGATMTCAGEIACTGSVSSAATATDPLVSPTARGSHSEGSCEGVTDGVCQAVTNSGASSASDANVIAPLVAERSTANATVSSGTTGDAPQRTQPQQEQPAAPVPAAPGSSANSGAPTVPGASSWTMANATLDCSGGGISCAGVARSASGSDGPVTGNGVIGARGPPAGGSTTSGSCATGVSGCRAQTSATAASGQVVADMIAEDRISTAVQLAEQAAQAEYDAALVAQLAGGADATPELKAAAADAMARAEQARVAASEAAELAMGPVTGAPATMSRSDGSARCAGPGCVAGTTGVTSAIAGGSQTAATCTAAASGCGVKSDASVATGRGSGAPASGQAGSLAVCSEAGCTATLSGSATAGDGTPSHSTATADTACIGAAACVAKISAGSSAAASAAGAGPDQRFATSSAFVEASCADGSTTGCAIRTSSTTDVTAAGDAGIRGRSTSTCAAVGRCSVTSGGLSANGLVDVTAGCAGAGCRIETIGTAAVPTRGGLNRAEARTECTAGASRGECAAVSQVAAGAAGAQASTSCQGSAGAVCQRTIASSSTASGAVGGTRVNADAACGEAGGEGTGWCATSAAADARTGLAMASAACEGTACSHSYRAESHAQAAGANADAVGHGAGADGGGHVMTTASASGGPGFAQASASCAGTAGASCRHSYSAVKSASAGGARASASGSGRGGFGSGGVVVTAQASTGPGSASASASCFGAANCRHSYSAGASQSASYQGAGPGGSTVRHTARASAFGSGGGGQGAGGVAVSARAQAGPTGASASASCTGARNCSASFESHSVADAYYDPKHHAHADADCSGSGSGGFCATSATAMADAKSAKAGSSCAGSPGAACRFSYFAHSDADLKTPTTKVNGGSDCGDSGGFGGGGCGTTAYTEVDANGVTRLYLGCEGPGCRFSGVGDADAHNLIAEGKAHQQCGQTGAGWCVLGVKAELKPDRERENFKIDSLGFCVGSAGANCQGSYSTHIDLGSSTVGDCSGVGSGGCHGETLTGAGNPVISYGVCLEKLACDWKASTHSDVGLKTADEKLSAEANADCKTSSAAGTACKTAAGLVVENNRIQAFSSCQGGAGPDCRYHAHTTAHDLNGMNIAESDQTCGQQKAGSCGVASWALALTGMNLRGESMSLHGEALAGGSCSGSFGTVCSGSYRTHVDSDRDTWSNCTGTGAGSCHGVADPWNANSTGTGSGNIESKSPDEHKSGSFTTFGPAFTPITIGANTHDTAGRFVINVGRGIGDAAESVGNEVVSVVEDTGTQFANIGRLAWTGVEEPRLPNESDAEYDARVWPMKHRFDTNPFVVQMSNIGRQAWTGVEEPHRPGETEDQYNARVWPLKHQWNQSMNMIGKISSGDGGRGLFWDPLGSVQTAISGPMMIIPSGVGQLASKGVLKSFGGGHHSAPDMKRIDVDGHRSGLGPDANCVNAVCTYGGAPDPDAVIPGDIPKAMPGSHDPVNARDMVEGAFGGRFTDITKGQFDRDMARVPDGTEVVTWGWRDGADASHMMYGLKTGGDLRFYDQRGRLTAGQAGAELDNLRQVLVRGIGGNGGSSRDLSNVPPVGSAGGHHDDLTGLPDEAGGHSDRLEGQTEIMVNDPAVTGRTITDIDRVEKGVLWEEKSATTAQNIGNWVDKHIDKKFRSYLEARQHLEGYENAPIGFHFTRPGADPVFKSEVERGLDALRSAYPDVDIRLDWGE